MFRGDYLLLETEAEGKIVGEGYIQFRGIIKQ